MEWLHPVFKGYVYSIATLFGAIGAMFLLLIWTYKFRRFQPWLTEPDPLFGFANRTVLLLAGALQLAFCGCLFAMRSFINQGLLILWAGLNCLLFRMAFVWLMKIKVPFPMENYMGRWLGVRPMTVDFCWKLFIAYLIIGSSTFMLLKLRQLKQSKDEAWAKQWLETREQTESFEKIKTQKLPVNADNFLKISCSPLRRDTLSFQLMRWDRKSLVRTATLALP